jgi:hypothetical protein
MTDDNLRPIGNLEVAETCEHMVRQIDVPFDAAWALAMAAQRIRELNDRVLVQSHRAEMHEADAQHLFHLHYGPQEGGAA